MGLCASKEERPNSDIIKPRINNNIQEKTDINNDKPLVENNFNNKNPSIHIINTRSTAGNEGSVKNIDNTDSIKNNQKIEANGNTNTNINSNVNESPIKAEDMLKSSENNEQPNNLSVQQNGEVVSGGNLLKPLSKDASITERSVDSNSPLQQQFIKNIIPGKTSPTANRQAEKSPNNFKFSTSNLLKQEPNNKNKNLEKQGIGIINNKNQIAKQQLLDDSHKVLLLGVGESGKSTVLKQFKVLHQGGYSQEELIKMKEAIYNNLLDIASDIITARNKFKIPITDDDLKGYPSIKDAVSFQNVLKMAIPDRSEYIKNNNKDGTNKEEEKNEEDDEEEDEPEEETENEYISNIESLPPIFFAYLAILWNTPATQALLHSKHRKYFHLLGNAPYFISRLEKISEKDYVPTVEDVLKCRVKTKGIQETYVKMKDGDITLHICDVGGQRVERKKWIYCFSNVSILIFCVSLSDYDRPLREDSKVNALSESIELFDSIVNSKWFVNTQVMLFLNKIDVFLQKLPSSPIKNYFPNYKGEDTDAKASVKHILGLLKERNRSNLVLYPHITQATDSSNIELVFTAMAEVVMENRIKKSGAI